MIPGMSAAKMQGMMKKMGISQTQLPVNRVIFEMDDRNLIINEPSVLKIKMQGQETYQVSGEATESPRDDSGEPESAESFSDEDVKMVMSQTEKSEDEARAALEKSDGDIAEAIIELKG